MTEGSRLMRRSAAFGSEMAAAPRTFQKSGIR